MVPVVPSFANRSEGYKRILRRPALLVVGMVAEEVRGRIHEPGGMEDENVAKESGDKDSVPKILAEELLGDDAWSEEAHEEGKPRIEAFLEHDETISLEVGKVKFFSLRHDVRVLLDVEPSHVSEEKAASCVVGVSVGFAVFVVHAMIAGPVPDGSLVCDRVCKHQEASHGLAGLVRPVAPQTVDSGRNPEARQRP